MPSQRDLLRGILCLAAGAALVIWIWSFNADRIGPFYDYSIILNNLQAQSSGMARYRDYPSVLQSGVVWLASASDLCFGHSYYALAIGNLALSLGTFVAAFTMLRTRLGPLLAALVGLGFCAGTVLQHGILWYNSLAISLLGLQCLLVARIPFATFSPFKHLLPVLLVAIVSGATKVNYHLLGVAFVTLLLFRIFVEHFGWSRGLFWLAVVSLILLFAGPLLECLVCGVSPASWARNVVLAPAGRARTIVGFFRRDFWLSTRWPYYCSTTPAVVLETAFLFAAVIALTFPPRTQDKSFLNTLARCEPSVILFAGWFGGALLILSNVEIQILNASFFLIAATCALLRLHCEHEPLPKPDAQQVVKEGPTPFSLSWGRGIKGEGETFHCHSARRSSAVALLALYFAITGAWSAARHARLRYDDPTSSPVLESSLRPVSDAFSLLSPYFKDLRTFPATFEKLLALRDVIERNKIDPAKDRVFWGPEFEFMNRVLGARPPEGIPLWFQRGVTYRVSQSDAIIEAFSKGHFQWFIAAADWSSEAPPSLLRHLTNTCHIIENKQLLVFHNNAP